MTNVVSLNPAKDTEDKVKGLEQEIISLETRLFEEKRKQIEANTKTDKDRTKKTVTNTELEIKIAKQSLEIAKNRLVEVRLQTTTAQTEQEKDMRAEVDELSIVAALKDMNANYIINTGEWHCVYNNGVRYQPQVRQLGHEAMADHVYRVADNMVDKVKLKIIAKSANRMFRDVERTFQSTKISTLNQMNELRTFWLKPIFDRPHHEAFDFLVNNVVGHKEEYKKQIEKYIAYSYVKPEDIFAPNIDSSAKGGAGRDTLFRMLEIIFTEECCGEAKKETVQGTHNGELNGKIWVKVSEQNNRAMNIEELKNLTGGHNFRLRTMGKDAIQVPRTFRFFMMSNNYEGTAKLTGGGGGAEDRRWEPILSSTSLLNVIADKKKIEIHTAKQLLQEWQDDVYQNEAEIAKWLGNIIDVHGYREYFEGKVRDIAKLAPLHGEYYHQMVARQKRVFDTFMEAVESLSDNSNCYVVDKMHKIYKLIAYTNKVPDKSDFAKNMAQWLTAKTGIDWEVRTVDYYRNINDGRDERSRSYAVTPVHKDLDEESANHVKRVFDISDFIDVDVIDEKEKPIGEKPHTLNIRSEFF